MNRLLILFLLTLLVIAIGYNYYYKKDIEYFQTSSTIDQQIINKMNEIRDLSNSLIDFQNYILDNGKIKNSFSWFTGSSIITGYPKKIAFGAYSDSEYNSLIQKAKDDCSNNTQCKAYQYGYNSKEQSYQYWLINTDLSKNMTNLTNVADWTINRGAQYLFSVFVKDVPLTKIRNDIKTKTDELALLRRQKEQQAVIPPQPNPPPPPPPPINTPTLDFTDIMGDYNYDIYRNSVSLLPDISSGLFITNGGEREMKNIIGRICSSIPNCTGISLKINVIGRENTINAEYGIKTGTILPNQLIGTLNNDKYSSNHIYITCIKRQYIAPLINTPSLTQKDLGPYGNNRYDFYENTDSPGNDINSQSVTGQYNISEYNKFIARALNVCSNTQNCEGVVIAYNKNNRTYNYYLKRKVLINQFIGTKNNPTFTAFERVDTFIKKPYSASSTSITGPISELCADVKFNNFVGDYCESIPSINATNTICKLKSGYTHNQSLCQTNLIGTIFIEGFNNKEHFLNTDTRKQEIIRKAYQKVTSKNIYKTKYSNNVNEFKKLVRDMWNKSIEVYYSNPLNLGSGGNNTPVSNFESINTTDRTGTIFLTIIDELYKVCDKSENIQFLYCSGTQNFYKDYNVLLAISNIIADATDF
jgi:hypothetical protein